MQVLGDAGIAAFTRTIGRVVAQDLVSIRDAQGEVLSASRTELRRAWSETSHLMQSLRDNPDCAREEYERATDAHDPGLFAHLTFDAGDDVAAPYVQTGVRPRVAILREQGVNSQMEMAAAFHRAGFESLDVHMTDLIAGRVQLDDFRGLVACGGFSYGDVLGAGEGWAKSILFNAQLREQFGTFFERSDTFTLGVCNGCQMLSALKPLIPGAEHWPRFVRNRSEQFEGRVGLVEVLPTPSVFFAGMAGSVLPIAIAHGEGRAEFADAAALSSCVGSGLVSLRFVDNHGRATETYPANPNGSPQGITGLTSRGIRNACSARCRTRGIRRTGARTAGGCGCSATPGCGSASGRTAAARKRQSPAAARPMLVIFGSDSSAKKRRTIIACCSLPLRT